MASTLVDARMARAERYWFCTPPKSVEMRVSDTVRDCALFVGVRDHLSGNVRYGGTAFLVSVPGESDTKRRFPYLVTAKHVTDRLRDLIGSGGTFIIRANLTDGTSVQFEAGFGHWTEHSDKSVDCAVSIFAPPLELALATRHVPLENFLTDDDIHERSIGAGDEVFITGLFTRAPGAERNMPIVRMGNIALMPPEKITHKGELIDAYLIEGRSIGGLSGSPAFVSETVRIAYPPPLAGKKQEFMWLPGQTYFLGLVRGHWDAPEEKGFAGLEDRVNMGIALVVPAKKIREILDKPDQKELRRLQEEELLRSDDSSTLDTDFGGDASTFTRRDFESALKKVSRKIEKPCGHYYRPK